jgi:hypothetical protein
MGIKTAKDDWSLTCTRYGNWAAVTSSASSVTLATGEKEASYAQPLREFAVFQTVPAAA